jgi:hypothetical protein
VTSRREDLGLVMQNLELSLLHTDFSEDPKRLERLLASDFREVNNLGRVSSRAAVRQWLLEKNPADRWELASFEAQQLSPALRLATYHARQVQPPRPDSKGSLHVSLWRLDTSAGDWQLVFHQATRCL